MTDTASLLDELRSRGATVAVVGDKLRVEAPRGTIEPDLLQTLRERKPEIIRLLAQSQVETGGTGKGKVPARVRGQDAVIESAQAEICFHCHGSNLCGCLLCAVRGQSPMKWEKGQCRACLGSGFLCWPKGVQ